MNIPPVVTACAGGARNVYPSPAEEAELRDPATWDWERPLVRERRYRKGRASVVVSVRFDADEADAVSAAAERLGLYISGFVRTAALNAARKGGS